MCDVAHAPGKKSNNRRAAIFRRMERDLNRTRTPEGRSRARKRGLHMGRPSKLADAQKAEARRRRADRNSGPYGRDEGRRGWPGQARPKRLLIGTAKTCPSRARGRRGRGGQGGGG